MDSNFKVKTSPQTWSYIFHLTDRRGSHFSCCEHRIPSDVVQATVFRPGLYGASLQDYICCWTGRFLPPQSC